MDPTENLTLQLHLARRLLEADADRDDALRLAELVEALDAWIAAGGVLPRRWERR